MDTSYFMVKMKIQGKLMAGFIIIKVTTQIEWLEFKN